MSNIRTFEFLTREIFISVDGVPQNVTNLIDEINLFENLFDDDPFITGNALFTDSIGFLEGAELRENEIKIIIKKSEEEEFEYTGKIYRISKVVEVTSTVKSFIVHFTSPAKYTDSNRLISKKYKGSHEKIIHDISKNILDINIDVEAMQSKSSFISNYWKPTKIITSIIKKTKNQDGVSNFFFFETKEGYFIKSLSNLINQESVRTYTKKLNLQNEHVSDEFDLDSYYIESYKILNYENTLFNKNFGSNSSLALEVDLGNKEFFEFKFVDEENPNDLSKLVTYIDDDSVFENGTTINKDISTYISKSISDKLLINNKRLEVIINGDTIINVGDVIELKINKQHSTNQGITVDENPELSGNYLIINLRRFIDRQKIINSVEVLKI